MTDYDDIGVGQPTLFTRIVHKLIPGAPKKVERKGKSTVLETTLLDPRHNDDLTVERRLKCGHAEWHEVEASLSNVWCNECWDMVEAEFRTLDGQPIEP